jgi:hypothetical protein
MGSGALNELLPRGLMMLPRDRGDVASSLRVRCFPESPLDSLAEGFFWNDIGGVTLTVVLQRGSRGVDAMIGRGFEEDEDGDSFSTNSSGDVVSRLHPHRREIKPCVVLLFTNHNPADIRGMFGVIKRLWTWEIWGLISQADIQCSLSCFLPFWNIPIIENPNIVLAHGNFLSVKYKSGRT